MSSFVSGLKIPAQTPTVKSLMRPYVPNGNAARREFSILEHLTGTKRRNGRNYFTRCPACARHGRDKSGDNLAISIVDPRKYKCWAGCSKEEIRAALGCPIKARQGLSV